MDYRDFTLPFEVIANLNFTSTSCEIVSCASDSDDTIPSPLQSDDASNSLSMAFNTRH